MPNKLTDAEVKKALEDKIEFENFDENEYAVIDIEKLKNALDLINRYEAEVERLKEDIKILRVSVEQAPLIRKDGKSPLSLLTAEIKAEAYKEFAERSEKEIFIKQDDRRKEMLEILKTYRGTRTYSDTEQATDNWLRGYGEAVQDVLGVFYNLLNELVGDGDGKRKD